MPRELPLPPISRGTLLLLLALSALAAALRTVNVNSQLWYDEIASLLTCFRPTLAHIATHYESNNNHPLYSLLAHAAIEVFGEHPWSVRLPAVLFGVAGIPTTFLLARLVTSDREAALATALLALSYPHVWFSQNARGYTALAFFVTLCTWLLLRGMRDNMPGWWLAYATAAALGTYTHATMAFVVAGHALALPGWLAFRPNGRHLLAPTMAAFVGSGLLALLLYAPMLGQVQALLPAAPKTGATAFASPRRAIYEVLGELAGVLGGNAAWWALALGAACIGMGSLWRRSRTTTATLLLPAVVTVVGVMAMRRPMHPRFLFFMAPVGALLVVRGFCACIALVRSRWQGASLAGGTRQRLETMLVLLAIVAGAPSLAEGYLRPKQDYAGALDYLDLHTGANDTVVVAGVTAALPLQRYYGRQWRQITDPAELERLAVSGARVWVVYTIPRYLERGSPELMAVIQGEFQVRAVFRGTLAGGEVVVCASRSRRAASKPAPEARGSNVPGRVRPMSPYLARNRLTCCRRALQLWDAIAAWQRDR